MFLAINAAGVWGGVFPFLPLEFQTSDIILNFFLAQSLVFFFTYFASTVGVYFFPSPTRRFLVVTASVPYLLGWVCLIIAMYWNALSLILVTVGGGLLGLGSAGFFMSWQRLFASQDSDTGNRDLIVGTAYSAVFYFSLYLLPRAVTAYLIPFVFMPLFGLCIVLKSRTINLDQPMFEDIPRQHPRIYRQALKDYWRSAVAIGALGFCCGIMRALAINDPQVGSFVNVMSMSGSLIAAIILLVLWQFKNVRFNITATYRLVFPFLITAFLVLPFVGEDFLTAFASVLYAIYSCAIMLMMIQCAQASRDRGINPVFIYGFFGTIVYALHDIGFAGGTLFGGNLMLGLSPLVSIALIAIYLLGLMYFIGQGGFKQFRNRRIEEAGHIELLALSKQADKQSKSKRDFRSKAVSLSADDEPPEDDGDFDGKQDEPQYRDRISKQCAALQQYYRLSARESEVMELIARGNSVIKIAEELVVSENTIRTHSKRIYTKLGIHKKQELLDLIETFSPSDIKMA